MNPDLEMWLAILPRKKAEKVEVIKDLLLWAWDDFMSREDVLTCLEGLEHLGESDLMGLPVLVKNKKMSAREKYLQISVRDLLNRLDPFHPDYRAITLSWSPWEGAFVPRHAGPKRGVTCLSGESSSGSLSLS